jgi:hypothetical protein
VRLDARSLAPIVILGLTSAGAYLAGTRLGGLRGPELPRAIMDVLGTLGLAVAFLVGNLAVGTAAVLGFRALTGHFISVYVVSDATLPILSVVQAMVFHRWRERSR